jgi:hypothetical protein
MELTVNKSNAQAAYEDADAVTKKLLENLFGKEHFTPQKITDRVKTFDDACSIKGIKPESLFNPGDTPDEKAYKKLKLIVEVLNEGWRPDWTKSGEYKYYPWFDLSSGSGLSYYGCADVRSASPVGSRLVFKSKDLAIYAAKQFEEIYKDFFIIQ